MTNESMNKGKASIWVIVGVVVMIVLIGGWVVLRGDDGVDRINDLGIEAVGEVNEEAKTIGEEVPEFRLKNYEGRVVSLADFAGKPVIINTWASWCPFCVKELDDFVAAQQQLGDEVVVIAINRGESLRQAKGFTDEREVSEGLVFLLDPTQSFYNDSGGFAMPETLFVNANGTIDFHKRGPMEAEEIVERATFLLR